MLAARVVPTTGRSRRIELEQPRYRELRDSVEGALEPDACLLAPESARLGLVRQWTELEPLLAGDVAVRAKERLDSLQRTLNRRREGETRRVETVFTQLRATLQAALEGPAALQLTLDDFDEPERHQFERDRQAWDGRLKGLDEEKARELVAIQARYAAVRELVFPFAVALCVPHRTAR